jgi:hypothetical protein
MHPAFGSSRSAALFGSLVAFSIALPLILQAVGLSTRSQAFSTIPVAGGPVGWMRKQIYEDGAAADVLLLGSSLVKTDVQPARLERMLSERMGRPMRVTELELNWYGADQQYYMLRDYLQHHPAPRLIVLHVPQARAYDNGPHPQAYRWLRYGELPDLPPGFPLFSKLQLYGEMVLGGPRQLLSLLRPNLIGIEETLPPPSELAVTEAPDSVPSASLLPATSPQFEVLRPRLLSEYRFEMGPYTLMFLHQIDELVNASGAGLVLLHLPLNRDPLSETVQEIEPWTTVFGSAIHMIAMPKAQFFHGVDPAQYYYPGDNHMNPLGGERFTDAIVASIAQAFQNLPQGRP